MARPEKLDPAEVARVANEINAALNTPAETNVVPHPAKTVVREDEAAILRHRDGNQSCGALVTTAPGTIHDFTAPHGVGTFAMVTPGGNRRLFCIIEAVTFTATETYYDVLTVSGFRSQRVESSRLHHLTSREVTELASVGNMLHLRSLMRDR